MSEASFEWCTRAGYVVLALFIAAGVLIFLAIWMRSYWAERDSETASKSRIRTAEKRFCKEREGWIGIISDLHDQLTDTEDELARARAEIDTLKGLLAKSEQLRKEHKDELVK